MRRTRLNAPAAEYITTAVQTARWKGGRGVLGLSDGSLAPVSRTYAAALKGTDWAADTD